LIASFSKHAFIVENSHKFEIPIVALYGSNAISYCLGDGINGNEQTILLEYSSLILSRRPYETPDPVPPDIEVIS
jgi:hypothetical protein